MKISVVVVAVASSLISIAACSSSSSTGGGTSAGTDGGTASNDSGSSTGTDSGGGSNPLSCQDDGSHLCTFYASIPKGAESTDCPSPDVVVTDCSTTSVVATCAYNSGGTDQVITWYTGVTANNATLKSTCDSLSGTFTAS